MTQTIEQLIARVRELEEENARLNAESRDACLGLNDYYGRKLAAEQLNNKLLRDAIGCLIRLCEMISAPDGPVFDLAKKAIATPISTEALDKYVAEKVKEIIESHAPEGRNVTNAQHVEMRHKFVEQIATLTRQRDLAVEALMKCRYRSLVDKVVDDTLEAIKESEAK
jgi:hypothetical protein